MFLCVIDYMQDHNWLNVFLCLSILSFFFAQTLQILEHYITHRSATFFVEYEGMHLRVLSYSNKNILAN